VDIVVGSIFVLLGIAGILVAPALAGRWRKRDERKEDPKRDLEWSQNFDTSIFRFLGVSLIVVGVLVLTPVIDL
jgi:hypothetical protein